MNKVTIVFVILVLVCYFLMNKNNNNLSITYLDNHSFNEYIDAYAKVNDSGNQSWIN